MVLYLIWFLSAIFGDPEFSITVTPIAPGFYVHTSYKTIDGQTIPSNGLIAETVDGIVMVDTPWDTLQTVQLLNWISSHLKKSVALCIITHAHEDRIGGINALRNRNIRVVSTPLTARDAANRGYQAPEPILPNDTMMTWHALKAECFFPGKGHTEDNIVVWFPDRRILFGGCLVKSADASGLGNIEDASLQDWPATVRNVVSRFPSPTIIIPGHGSWADTTSLQHTLDLLQNAK